MTLARYDLLWVVEIRHRKMRRWEATSGASCTRQTARQELAEWKSNYPTDRFRLVRYTRND